MYMLYLLGELCYLIHINTRSRGTHNKYQE